MVEKGKSIMGAKKRKPRSRIPEGGKDYFTVPRLVSQPWFPIHSVITLRKLIESKQVKAANVSTNPKLKRYHIHQKDIAKFLLSKFKDSLGVNESEIRSWLQ